MVEANTHSVTPADRIHTLDQQLAHRLVIGLRTAALHEIGNATLEAAVEELHRAVRLRLADTGSVTISARNQCLFVERDRLRVAPVNYANVQFLIRKLEEWTLPGLCFNAQIQEQEVRELLVFLGRMSPDTSADPPWGKGGGIGAEAPSAKPTPATRADDTLRTFAAAMDISRDLYDAFGTSDRFRQRSLRRVTQSMVDLLREDEHVLLGMTSIKNFDGYLFNHCANVAVLSAALGQRLGLNKARLGELCLAALLHDLGKTLVPKEVLDKTGDLTDEDWVQLRRHPVHSVEILLGQGRVSPGMLAAIVAGFEHHVDYDLTGYPPLVNKDHHITLFGRIIAIADCYDAITTPRAYRAVNLTPFDGVRFLLGNMGTKFDPILVRLFIELLGVYPPGTMVRLSSGEVGVVSRPPLPAAPLDRPLVRIARGPASGSLVDLSEACAGPGARPAVVEVINPDNLGLLPALDMTVLQAPPEPEDS